MEPPKHDCTKSISLLSVTGPPGFIPTVPQLDLVLRWQKYDNRWSPVAREDIILLDQTIWLEALLSGTLGQRAKLVPSLGP